MIYDFFLFIADSSSKEIVQERELSHKLRRLNFVSSFRIGDNC